MTGSGTSSGGGPVDGAQHDPFAGSPRAMAALIVVAGTTQAVISWLQGGVALSRESVIEQIAHVILAAVRP